MNAEKDIVIKRQKRHKLLNYAHTHIYIYIVSGKKSEKNPSISNIQSRKSTILLTLQSQAFLPFTDRSSLANDVDEGPGFPRLGPRGGVHGLAGGVSKGAGEQRRGEREPGGRASIVERREEHAAQAAFARGGALEDARAGLRVGASPRGGPLDRSPRVRGAGGEERDDGRGPRGHEVEIDVERGHVEGGAGDG